MQKTSRLTYSYRVTRHQCIAETASKFDWYSRDMMQTSRVLASGTRHDGNSAGDPLRELARHSLDLCIAAVAGLLGIALDVCLLSIFISHIQSKSLYAG